jgi:hypothetical protein
LLFSFTQSPGSQGFAVLFLSALQLLFRAAVQIPTWLSAKSSVLLAGTEKKKVFPYHEERPL